MCACTPTCARGARGTLQCLLGPCALACRLGPPAKKSCLCFGIKHNKTQKMHLWEMKWRGGGRAGTGRWSAACGVRRVGGVCFRARWAQAWGGTPCRPGRATPRLALAAGRTRGGAFMSVDGGRSHRHLVPLWQKCLPWTSQQSSSAETNTKETTFWTLPPGQADGPGGTQPGVHLQSSLLLHFHHSEIQQIISC